MGGWMGGGVFVCVYVCVGLRDGLSDVSVGVETSFAESEDTGENMKSAAVSHPQPKLLSPEAFTISNSRYTLSGQKTSNQPAIDDLEFIFITRIFFFFETWIYCKLLVKTQSIPHFGSKLCIR